MTRTSVAAAVVVLLLAALLTACRSDETDEPPATMGSAETSATGETAVTTPTGASATNDETLTPETPDEPNASATAETPAVPATEVPQPTGTVTVSILDQALTVPVGYTVNLYAEDLGVARFMAYDAEGQLYVTDRAGRVLRAADVDGDGVADRVDIILSGLSGPHGITFHEDALYVAEETRVLRAEDGDDDGVFESVETLIDDLPEGGHSSRTIQFGPDGMIYVSIGSSCNVCVEEDPLRAAIWRYDADGSGGELFAAGLRNAVGIVFHPETGELWATNNGRDLMGEDLPSETINQPTLGDNFGWPFCHSGDVIDPDLGDEDACEGVAQPAVEMQAHSAPLGLTFDDAGDEASPFDGDMFVAFHGSWNREEPTGYKVVRIPFDGGRPTGEVLDFVTGWLLPDGEYWGRPVDVIVAPDGSLLISDDDGGRIFRVSRAD